jgi:hypothetical protein
MARTFSKEVNRVLLQALACGATVENAARKAGVCERTVYRHLADAAFCRRLSQLRTEMVQRTAGMLTGAGMGSVKTLLDLQGDASVSPSVRRRSARDILELGLKLREIAELEQRLAAVEARLAGSVGNSPDQSASVFHGKAEEFLDDAGADSVQG